MTKQKFIDWRNTIGYLVTLIKNIPEERFMNKETTLNDLNEIIDYIDEQKVEFARTETERIMREIDGKREH